MSFNRSLPSQACWTLTALIALSLLPACLRAQDFQYRAVRTDADVALVTEQTEGVIVYPRVTVAGGRALAKFNLKAVAAYPDDSKLDVSGPVLQALLSCPSLQSVAVRNSAALTDDDFAPLANLRHLNTLELRTLPGITAVTLKYAAVSSTLAELSLTECEKVSSTALADIAQMPLVALTLQGRQFDLSGMNFAQTANLAYLSLQEIAAVDDAFVGGLGHFPLAQLSISSASGSLPGITEKGIASIAAISSLKVLELDGAGNLTDRLMQRLGALDHLSNLSLTGGKAPSLYLTSAGVLALVRSKSIASLSLGGQDKITWTIGKHFSAGASIRSLDLSNTNMDDATLKLLATRLQRSRLVSLSTEGCAGVSDAGRIAANKVNACVTINGESCGEGAWQ